VRGVGLRVEGLDLEGVGAAVPCAVGGVGGEVQDRDHLLWRGRAPRYRHLAVLADFRGKPAPVLDHVLRLDAMHLHRLELGALPLIRDAHADEAHVPDRQKRLPHLIRGNSF